MSIELKLSRTGINANATEMYVADITDWDTAESSRSEKAIIIQAKLHKSDSDVDVEVVTYDPETVTSFTLKCNEDGYYEIIAVAVDDSVPTVEGSYGWTSVSGLVQLVDGNLIPKTVEDVFADDLFFDAVSFKTVLVGRMSMYRNSKNLELVKLKIARADDRSHNKQIENLERNFEFAITLLEGARYQWCIDNYTQAQSIIEAFNNVINE